MASFVDSITQVRDRRMSTTRQIALASTLHGKLRTYPDVKGAGVLGARRRNPVNKELGASGGKLMKFRGCLKLYGEGRGETGLITDRGAFTSPIFISFQSDGYLCDGGLSRSSLQALRRSGGIWSQGFSFFSPIPEVIKKRKTFIILNYIVPTSWQISALWKIGFDTK